MASGRVATSQLTQSDKVVSNLGRVAWEPRRSPSIRPSTKAIIEAVSGFSSVSCRETWRVPVPESGTGCIGSSLRSPNSRPGVGPEGLSLALPMAAPEGQAPSRCVSRSRGRAVAPPMPVRKSGHHRSEYGAVSDRGAPCVPASSSRLRRNGHAIGSQLPHTLSCDEVAGLRRSHRAGLWTDLQAGRIPSHSSSPVRFPVM